MLIMRCIKIKAINKCTQELLIMKSHVLVPVFKCGKNVKWILKKIVPDVFMYFIP